MKEYCRAYWRFCLLLSGVWAFPVSVLSSPGAEKKVFYAQNQVTGMVTDKGGEPLIGVNITVKGLSTGTATDLNGKFVLDGLGGDAILVFSYVGYQTQEVPVAGRNELSVTLITDAEVLDEVVVVGYGSVKKSDLTGSVSSVKIDQLKEGVVSSVDQLLVGKSAGVNVVQGSGEPGAGFSINIRGSSSINAGNDPLYVIDGIPVDNSRSITRNGVGIGNTQTPRSPLASLNPGDIESIEILKDASATAIYGSRGANGVVLITTKGGASGDTKVNYNSYVGVQNWHNKLDLLDGNDYKRVLNEIIDAGGADPSFRIPDNISRTDWQDAIAHTNALVHSHQLSVSGGSEKLSYYASLNLLDQDGIINSSSYKRYGGRVNLDSKLSDKFSVGLKITNSYSTDDFVANGGAAIENSGALQAAYTYDPTIAVRDENGNYLRNELISVDNPVALINGVDSRSVTNRTLVSAYAQYNINKNLTAKVNFGRDYANEDRKTFVYDITRMGSQNNGLGNNQGSNRSHVLVDGTINYNKTFTVHSISALAGVNYERFITERFTNTASDFPSLTVGANNLGLGKRDNFLLSNSKVAHSLASYFGRINYSFNNKYLVTLTARLDGSSRFGENNKFALFPSSAIGWKLNEEDFLKDVDFINSLKLRASWGQSGNQGIGNYAALSSYREGQVGVFDNIATTTTTPTRIPNPDLKWETTEQINLGIDFGFWDNRIEGSIDFYDKTTKDMLLNLPIPSSTGFRTQLSNIGKIRNRGFEFAVNSWNLNKSAFQWNSSLSVSTLKNEVLSLGPIPEIIVGGAPTWGGGVGVIRPGEALNSFIGWEVAGIWQTDDNYSETTENVKPGDIKFVDRNGDGAITDDDRVILGSSFPTLQYSLGNTFTFKKFDLFVFLDGISGAKILSTKMVETFYPINFRRNKLAEPYLNRWTPDNPTNKYPSFVNPTDQGVRSVNSFTVEDGSYLKLRTVRLSYTLPVKGKTIRSAQVYVTGENLLTFTDYSGIDPAINPNGEANYRIDLNTYPSARTYLLGINIDL